MACTDDQITLPVTEASTFGYNGGAPINRHLIWNRAAAFTNSVAFPARLLAAQGVVQGATGTLVGIDTLIDSLVADGGFAIGLEVAGNLFRTPRLGQPGIDNGPCFSRNARAVFTGTQAGL